MTRKSILIITGLLLISTLILAGCGGGTNVADVHISGIPDTGKYGNLKITTAPEYTPFPDIPIYPGAKVATGKNYSSLYGGTGASTTGTNTQWQYYETGTSESQKVQDYYKSVMPDHGWTKLDMEGMSPSPDGITSVYMKGTKTSVSIMTFTDPTNPKKMILAIWRTSME